jgi:hypothetical protein
MYVGTEERIQLGDVANVHANVPRLRTVAISD